jgi:hypothetical protein
MFVNKDLLLLLLYTAKIKTSIIITIELNSFFTLRKIHHHVL